MATPRRRASGAWLGFVEVKKLFHDELTLKILRGSFQAHNQPVQRGRYTSANGRKTPYPRRCRYKYLRIDKTLLHQPATTTIMQVCHLVFMHRDPGFGKTSSR
jgi:hypothetical protein